MDWTGLNKLKIFIAHNLQKKTALCIIWKEGNWIGESTITKLDFVKSTTWDMLENMYIKQIGKVWYVHVCICMLSVVFVQ